MKIKGMLERGFWGRYRQYLYRSEFKIIGLTIAITDSVDVHQGPAIVRILTFASKLYSKKLQILQHFTGLATFLHQDMRVSQSDIFQWALPKRIT
jgi:hypothetical protein